MAWTLLPRFSWKAEVDEILDFSKQTFLNDRLHVKLLFNSIPDDQSKDHVKANKESIIRASQFNFAALSAALYRYLISSHLLIAMDYFENCGYHTFSGPDVGGKLNEAVREWRASDWH